MRLKALEHIFSTNVEMYRAVRNSFSYLYVKFSLRMWR
jgi:hypothetical protein